MDFPLSTSYTYNSIQNSKWIIIFVHWLTSSQNEEIFVRSEKYFNKNYYSTIRFNLYWDLPKERKLNEVSLQDNIDDVNQVINYCHKLWYEKIFLVWHSYWWIANLYVNHEFVSWILMRDSSIGWNQLLSDVYLDDNWKHYIDWWDWYKHYISEKLYQDFQMSEQIFLKQISEIKIPIKIIWAEKWLWGTAKKYYEYAKKPKELIIISWADHRFLEWWMNMLFDESIKRIKKYSKK